MSSNRARRVTKEIADVHADKDSGLTVNPVGYGQDIFQLKGSFKGPPGTPYEGGTWHVDIKIPNEYPFRPPVMRFDTKIWHPNVSSQTGAICLDTLGTAWSPILTIKSSLLSLQSLLSTPEPKDPQDAEVARMLIKRPAEFARVAHEWAVRFAGAPQRELGEGSGASSSNASTTAAAKSKEMEEAEEAERIASYGGYNEAMIDNFVNMGFEQDRIVAAFDYVGIDPNDGEQYELEEAYIGDITARLLGEP